MIPSDLSRYSSNIQMRTVGSMDFVLLARHQLVITFEYRTSHRILVSAHPHHLGCTRTRPTALAPAFARTHALSRLELREQKARLDKEFGEMLGKIADRKDRLLHMEKKLATLDRTRLGKEVCYILLCIRIVLVCCG